MGLDMTYEIRDEGTLKDEKNFVLLVNGSRMAAVTKVRNQPTQLVWMIYGPQYWPAAKEVLLGLLELGVHADRLTRGADHEKSKHPRR